MRNLIFGICFKVFFDENDSFNLFYRKCQKQVPNFTFLELHARMFLFLCIGGNSTLAPRRPMPARENITGGGVVGGRITDKSSN